MKNERLQALKLLTDLLENRHSLAQIMPSGQEISPMTRELCFGFCRHYYRLEAIALRLVDKKPKAIEVWVALLMGLYQLHYMKTPDYAVVKETVALLEKTKKTWAKGLINAVLRRFCREQEHILTHLKDDPVFVYGQSPILLSHFKKDWPQDWQQIALANDAHPPMTLRVNTQRVSVANYLKLLKEKGITASLHAATPHGINLEIPCDVYNLPGFEDGLVSVQDGAAQLAVSLLDLKPGLMVLDACCAPGGKTCHILESEPGLAGCVALDIEPKRLTRVKENLKRLRLTAKVTQGDALAVQSWWDMRLFDRILLDAPCSAVGVQRRHSDIKLLRTDEDIVAITQIQKGMLEALWPLLAPGGLMVYATCSIINEENEGQIASFVAKHGDCQVIKNETSWGRDTGHGRQILPGEYGMDGFFYSVLIKDIL
jgi:16S rRNA (cytosine967-C5)-methyltransferase